MPSQKSPLTIWHHQYSWMIEAKAHLLWMIGFDQWSLWYCHSSDSGLLSFLGPKGTHFLNYLIKILWLTSSPVFPAGPGGPRAPRGPFSRRKVQKIKGQEDYWSGHLWGCEVQQWCTYSLSRFTRLTSMSWESLWALFGKTKWGKLGKLHHGKIRLFNGFLYGNKMKLQSNLYTYWATRRSGLTPVSHHTLIMKTNEWICSRHEWMNSWILNLLHGIP